ncbi:uncharacterized protein LOC108330634 isoform X3 [Vigna angularis]|uniref:uncharacterized protein LOC108330634 isoform X3 n=1 Tax=Phaseolus angularis TaxID=3914 RepID=UPI0022B328D2|nr:uncharacterized protein LOC108330634 isoform X3 [Vigna angularis]
MSEGNQIDDSKNDDVAEDESSPVQRDEPEEKIRKRDHIDILSHPNVMRLLNKQGDQIVLFADKVLKFTGSGKMKYRYLMITDFAVYLIDPETDSLRRRIALAAVEKICVSLSIMQHPTWLRRLNLRKLKWTRLIRHRGALYCSGQGLYVIVVHLYAPKVCIILPSFH